MTCRRLCLTSWVAWVGLSPLSCPLDAPPPPPPIHLAIAVGGFASSPPAGTPGFVVDVHDGDTVTVRIGDELVTVRLLGADAPELLQGEPGRAARNWLVGRVAGKPVRLVEDSHQPRDVYGRKLAWLFVDDCNSSSCINVEMVRAGQAFAWRPAHSGSLDHWAEVVGAEKEAKAAGIGVWADDQLMRPWEWRAKRRKGR